MAQMMYCQVNTIGFQILIDGLLLISGNDIPFPEARLTIHQPTLNEISFINETSFWMGCQLLKFNKDIFKANDKKKLQQFSDLTLLLTMVQQDDLDAKKAKINMLKILAIIFPSYSIQFQGITIKLTDSQTGENFYIDEQIFSQFQNIIKQMFCLNGLANEQYDPSGDLAKKIADQIKRGKQKRAQLGPSDDKEISLFNRYISILATAKNKSIKEIMNYTVYQLLDEYNRFMLWYSSDQWFKLKIAGATGMDEQPDWFKNIHSNK